MPQGTRELNRRARTPRDLPVIHIVGPGPQHRGGISRYTNYLLEAEKPDNSPHLAIIDTYSESRLRGSMKYALALFRVARLPRGSRVHYNVSVRGSTLRKGVLSAVSRFRQHHYVLHIHGSGYPEFYSSLPIPLRRMLAPSFRGAEMILVLSEADRQQLSAMSGIRADRFKVVPNGVPGPSTAVPRHIRDVPVIAFLGDLGSRKGARTLVEALATLGESVKWAAVLAGTGSTDELRELAERLGIGGRVTVRPWLSPPEVADVLRAADVLALPSSAEGLPLAVLEAMANSLAVVASPVGGLSEALASGAGLLVRPGDADELATALARLLGDPSFLSLMKTAARRRWLESYSIERNLEQIYHVHGGIS